MGYGCYIPEGVAEFFFYFLFIFGGDFAGVIADDFFEFVGYFAGFSGEAEDFFEEGGIGWIGGWVGEGVKFDDLFLIVVYVHSYIIS